MEKQSTATEMYCRWSSGILGGLLQSLWQYETMGHSDMGADGTRFDIVFDVCSQWGPPKCLVHPPGDPLVNVLGDVQLGRRVLCRHGFIGLATSNFLHYIPLGWHNDDGGWQNGFRCGKFVSMVMVVGLIYYSLCQEIQSGKEESLLILTGVESFAVMNESQVFWFVITWNMCLAPFHQCPHSWNAFLINNSSWFLVDFHCGEYSWEVGTGCTMPLGEHTQYVRFAFTVGTWKVTLRVFLC